MDEGQKIIGLYEYIESLFTGNYFAFRTESLRHNSIIVPFNIKLNPIKNFYFNLGAEFSDPTEINYSRNDEFYGGSEYRVQNIDNHMDYYSEVFIVIGAIMNSMVLKPHCLQN